MTAEHEKNAYENLRNLFLYFGPIPENAWKYLKKRSRVIDVKKGEIILKDGTKYENLYFIYKGVLRGYVKEGTHEITTWINEENELSGAISALADFSPSLETVQAIEDSMLIELPIDAVDYIYDHFPETNRTGRLILTHYYIEAEQRALLARISSAEERYRRFMEKRASLTNRISLKYIASYLNMKVETLSRIRSKRL